MSINWNSSWEIGIKEIDRQHRELIHIVNDLAVIVEDGGSIVKLEEILDRLIDYIRIHFETEERYMLRDDYDKFDDHRGKHIDLTTKVIGFRTRYITSRYIDGRRLLDFLKNWLVDHLEGTDSEYGRFLRERKQTAI